MYFIRGSLPWQGLPAKTKEEKYEQIKIKKAKKILNDVRESIDNDKSLSVSYHIKNTDRSIGARVSGYVASQKGEAGLPNSININFDGSAGQSFGCWNASGVNLTIEYIRKTSIDYFQILYSSNWANKTLIIWLVVGIITYLTINRFKFPKK